MLKYNRLPRLYVAGICFEGLCLFAGCGGFPVTVSLNRGATESSYGLLLAKMGSVGVIR